MQSHSLKHSLSVVLIYTPGNPDLKMAKETPAQSAFECSHSTLRDTGGGMRLKGGRMGPGSVCRVPHTESSSAVTWVPASAHLLLHHGPLILD